MNCSRCGKATLQRDAQFCMHCGGPLQPQSAHVHASEPTSPSFSASLPSSRKATMTAIAAGIIVLALASFGVFRYLNAGVTKATGTAAGGPSAVKATGDPNAAPSVLRAQGKPDPGLNMLTNTGQRPPDTPPPPKDIVDWLAHLKRTELRRQDMGKRMSGEVSNLIPRLMAGNLQAQMSEDPDAELQKAQVSVQNMIETMRHEWQILQQDFQSRQPPQACLELANNYWQVLFEYPKASLALLDAIAKSDLAAAKSVKGDIPKLSQRIDASNAQLTLICRKYGIAQDFRIEQERGLGAMDSMLGIGM